MARSLLIYYGKPGRARRDLQFYRQFIGQGALVFDVGAHVGNRVGVFLRLGARCLAVEPQPAFAALLRLLYGRHPAFTLEQTALGASPGTADLHISRRTPTVSTIAPGWKERVAKVGIICGSHLGRNCRRDGHDIGRAHRALTGCLTSARSMSKAQSWQCCRG